MAVLRCFALSVVLSFLLSCPSFAQDNLKKVTFVPLWKPQAQFAGYYAALEKGIYKKHGLDVAILQGGPDFPPAEAVENGKADFGIVWLSSAIQRRASGAKLVNISQVLQESALMLVTMKAGGIVSPEDFAGKKVSVWDGDLSLQPRAFFRKYGVEPNIVTQSYTVNLFLEGAVDAASAMLYNEYDTIVNSGIDPDELSVFRFSDYGLNFPEDGIYCLESTLESDPGAAAAFVKASFEGWKFVLENENESLDIVLKYMREAHVPANRVHQKWMLARMKDLIFPTGRTVSPGLLDKKDYDFVCGQLLSEALIKEAPDYSVFFKPISEYVQE